MLLFVFATGCCFVESSPPSLSLASSAAGAVVLTAPRSLRFLAPNPPDPSYPIFVNNFIPIPFVCFSHLPKFGSFFFFVGGCIILLVVVALNPRPPPPIIILLLPWENEPIPPPIPPRPPAPIPDNMLVLLPSSLPIIIIE